MALDGFRPDDGSEARPIRSIARQPNIQDKWRSVAQKYGPIGIAILSIIVIGFAVFWPTKEKTKKEEPKKENPPTPVTVHVHNRISKDKDEPIKKEEPKKEEPIKEEQKQEEVKKETKKEDKKDKE